MCVACLLPWCGGGRSSNRRLERDLDWFGLPSGRDHQAAAQGLPHGMCRGKSLHGMAKSVEDPEIRSKAKTLELAWRRHGWPPWMAADVGCGCWPRMVFSQKTRAWYAMAMPCHSHSWQHLRQLQKSVQARLQKTKSLHRWVAGKPGSSSQVDHGSAGSAGSALVFWLRQLRRCNSNVSEVGNILSGPIW